MSYRPRSTWDTRRDALAANRLAYARAFCWLMDLARHAGETTLPLVHCRPGCTRVSPPYCHCRRCGAPGEPLDAMGCCWGCSRALTERAVQRASFDRDVPER